MEIPSLDDPKVFLQYDPQGMLKCIHEMPDLCQNAWQMAQAFNLPDDYRQVEKVVISGMGGSAIGGDLIRSLTASEAKIPVFVLRDYGLPAFVDGGALFLSLIHI